MIINRKARLIHKDGAHHVEHEADVKVDGFTYPYRSHHMARKDINHERILTDLDAKLEHRARIIGDVFSLIGTSGSVSGLPYRIIEANIQVHGPADFRLYVAWDEEHDGQKVRKDLRRRYQHPADCPDKASIRAMVMATVGSAAIVVSGARTRIEAFVENGRLVTVPKAGDNLRRP
jgi:hypothetical protein